MKRLILFLTAAACASAQPMQTASSLQPNPPAVKSDAARAGLHGPVHTVRTDTEPQGSAPPHTSTSLEDTYSPDGWHTEGVRFVNSVRVFHGLWQRDGQRLIRTDFEIREHPDPRNEIVTYDTQGRPIEKLVHNPDGSLRERTVRSYEERGTVETTYDGKGRVIDSYLRHTRTTQSGNSTTSETYTDNELESRTVVQHAGDTTDRRTQHFDRDGRLNMATAQESDGRTTNFALSTEYGNGVTDSKDSNGLLSVQTLYDGHLAIKRYSGPDGRLNRLESYRDGKLIRKEEYSYEDDGSGNWIRMTVTRDLAGQTSTKEIVRRTITYY